MDHQSEFYKPKNFCVKCGCEVDRTDDENETKCEKCGTITVWDFYLGIG